MRPVAVVGCGGGGSQIVSAIPDGSDILKVTVNVGLSEASISMGPSGEKSCLGDPALGWALTSENVSKIHDVLSKCSAVVVVAGLGGGVGSGAISVVTECARSMGLRAVSAVVLPFPFEAERRARAVAQLEHVVKGSDRTVVADLGLLGNVTGDTAFKDFIDISGRILGRAVLSIARMTRGPFESLLTAKSYTMAYSESLDPVSAVSSAMKSPLCHTDPAGGKIIVSADNDFLSGDGSAVRTAICDRTGIMPELVVGNGAGRGMLLFIPMTYRFL